MDEPRQGIFDFTTGNPDGFENWRRQQAARVEAIRREWGVPLNRRVRLRLLHLPGEFEGRLQLAEQPPVIDRHRPLRLRLNTLEFLAAEIEACVVLD